LGALEARLLSRPLTPGRKENLMANNVFEFAKGLPPWVILGFGVITGSLRTAWSFLYQHTIGYAMTRISISLTVEDAEHREAYLWLSYWVEKNLRHRRINSLLLRKQESDDGYCQRESSPYQLIPEYGTYYLKYKGRLMVVEHIKEGQLSNYRPRASHYMRLQIWLSWDRNVILDILEEAKTAYEQMQSISVEYFRADRYGEWNQSGEDTCCRVRREPVSRR
jgi:BCS1 N terminal